MEFRRRLALDVLTILVLASIFSVRAEVYCNSSHPCVCTYCKDYVPHIPPYVCYNDDNSPGCTRAPATPQPATAEPATPLPGTFHPMSRTPTASTDRTRTISQITWQSDSSNNSSVASSSDPIPGPTPPPPRTRTKSAVLQVAQETKVTSTVSMALEMSRPEASSSGASLPPHSPSVSKSESGSHSSTREDQSQSSVSSTPLHSSSRGASISRDFHSSGSTGGHYQSSVSSLPPLHSSSRGDSISGSGSSSSSSFGPPSSKGTVSSVASSSSSSIVTPIPETEVPVPVAQEATTATVTTTATVATTLASGGSAASAADVQGVLVVGLSTCSPPMLRGVAKAGRSAVVPWTVQGTNTSLGGLLGCVILLVLLVLVHFLASVIFVKVSPKHSGGTLDSSLGVTRFPSRSLAFSGIFWQGVCLETMWLIGDTSDVVRWWEKVVAVIIFLGFLGVPLGFYIYAKKLGNGACCYIPIDKTEDGFMMRKFGPKGFWIVPESHRQRWKMAYSQYISKDSAWMNLLLPARGLSLAIIVAFLPDVSCVFSTVMLVFTFFFTWLPIFILRRGIHPIGLWSTTLMTWLTIIITVLSQIEHRVAGVVTGWLLTTTGILSLVLVVPLFISNKIRKRRKEEWKKWNDPRKYAGRVNQENTSSDSDDEDSESPAEGTPQDAKIKEKRKKLRREESDNSELAERVDSGQVETEWKTPKRKRLRKSDLASPLLQPSSEKEMSVLDIPSPPTASDEDGKVPILSSFLTQSRSSNPLNRGATSQEELSRNPLLMK